jgi:hypothetical protein
LKLSEKVFTEWEANENYNEYLKNVSPALLEKLDMSNDSFKQY